MNLRTKVFLFLALGIFTCASGIALAKAPSTATASTQSSDNISVINILDNKATMTLPEEFKRMSAKQLATQYAAANPPPKKHGILIPVKCYCPDVFFSLSKERLYRMSKCRWLQR